MPDEPSSLDQRTPVDHLVARLQPDFPSVESRRIREVVEIVHDSYANARIRAYVAIFVERESRLRLRTELIPLPAAAHDDAVPVPAALAAIVSPG